MIDEYEGHFCSDIEELISQIEDLNQELMEAREGAE